MGNKLVVAVLFLSIILGGCSQNTGEHEHEPAGLEPLVYTVYTGKTELFVEFKPLVVGSNSKFATHLTVLGKNFIAMNEGTVTVSLIVGNKGIKHTVNAPGSPGIFRLMLKPVTAGMGKLIFDIQTPSYTDRIIIDSVTVYPDEKTAMSQLQPEPAGNEIAYTKEQAWKVEFANEVVNKQPFSGVIKTNGQILPAPGDEIVVTAKASGIVLFSGNNSIVGSPVNAGRTLFTITGGDLTEGNVDAKFKEVKANYEIAKANYERAEELVKDKIVSQKEYLQAKTGFDNAQTAYNAISKNYSAGGQGVSSAISGFVKNILVTEGQYVESGTPLATISKNRKLVLRADIAQKHFDKLSSITSANFTSSNNDAVLNTSELNGKVISYGKSTSPDSPFIPITFEIDNTGNLIPGSVAEIYLKTEPIPDALTVPETALIEEQGIFYVYVQTGGESFQKREVKTGVSDGINVQVLSGITDGERVVTKGAYQIKLSVASGTMPAHGHEH